MKFLFFLISFLITVQSQKFQIHVFQVGSADSQLIIFPSGYTILIDLGEDADFNGSDNANAEYIGKRIVQLTGRKEIDVFVLSHYHIDHHGHLYRGGITYLVETLGFKINKFIDRNCATFTGKTSNECNEGTLEFQYIGDVPGAMPYLLCYTANLKNPTKLSSIREGAEICSTLQIEPPDEGAEVQIIISDAYGIKDSNGNLISKDRRGDSSPPDENTYSIALRIQYKDFVYSTSGDLTGKLSEGGEVSIFDVESQIAKMVGEVDVLNTNHHGRKESSNAYWCNTLKPTVSIVSVDVKEAGDNNGPHDSVLTNLQNVGSQVYFTDRGNPDVTYSYSNTHVFATDIVITVSEDVSTFTVHKKDGSSSATYNVKKNKPAREACHTLI